MANTCGGCQLYQGSSIKCAGGYSGRTSNSGACNNFKGPASLFKSKVCGGCRLYQGSKIKCGGNYSGRTTSSGACNNYAPIPG